MAALFDPLTPWRWLDGTPRSQDNGFTMGFTGTPLDLAELQATAKAVQVAIKRNAELKARGVDQSVIALRQHRRRTKVKEKR